MRPRTCEARRQVDQYRCDRCDLLWDVDDDDPPVCVHESQVQGRKTLDELKELFNV